MFPKNFQLFKMLAVGRITLFLLVAIILLAHLGINQFFEERQRKLEIARIILRSSCKDFDDMQFALELGKYFYYRGFTWRDWRDTYSQIKSHTQDAIQLGLLMKQDNCLVRQYTKPKYFYPVVNSKLIGHNISELKILLSGMENLLVDRPPVPPKCFLRGLCGPQPKK